jgi:hypothetical protein
MPGARSRKSYATRENITVTVPRGVLEAARDTMHARTYPSLSAYLSTALAEVALTLLSGDTLAATDALQYRGSMSARPTADQWDGGSSCNRLRGSSSAYQEFKVARQL